MHTSWRSDVEVEVEGVYLQQVIHRCKDATQVIHGKMTLLLVMYTLSYPAPWQTIALGG